MNSTKETILARWHKLSTAIKMLLNQKAPLINNTQEDPLSIISDLSCLSTGENPARSLIITENVSDAIFLHSILKTISTTLSLQLILPHNVAEKLMLDKAEITIVPFSLFSLVNVRNHPLDLSQLNTLIIEQALPTDFLYDLLFANNENPLFLAEEAQTLLISANFKALTQKITAHLPAEKRDNIATPVQREKISLKPAKVVTAELATQNESKVDKLATKPTKSQNSIADDSPKDAPKDAQKRTPLPKKVEIGEFIGMVPRNLQRQYIRDYIREHNLQNTLIVTHNRQSARLLEKYLYRARIRSRIVHEKIDDETANSLFERYNNGQFNVLILMHRVVQDLAEKIEKCDAVIFLDFPSVYAEYADRISFTRQKFAPQHLVSIASENDRAWVDAFIEEYPDINLPTIEIDIAPPKRRHNAPADDKQDQKRHPKKAQRDRRTNDTAATAAKTHVNVEVPETESVTVETNNTNNSPSPEETKQKQHERRSNHRKEHAPRQERTHQRDRNDTKPRQQRTRGDQQPQHNTDHHEMGDSQSDFFSRNQDEIVNQNRLPFESGSFEANIARENRRRGRDPFGGMPGGLGQSTNGNFIQNLTQGFSANQNPNSRDQGKRTNNRDSRDNRGGRNNNPNNRGRKK